MNLEVTPRFAVGNLVCLSPFGESMLFHRNGHRLVKFGVIIDGPYDLFYPHEESDQYCEFWSYDIVFGDELFTMVPQEFLMDEVFKYEEDTE